MVTHYINMFTFILANYEDISMVDGKFHSYIIYTFIYVLEGEKE